MTSNHSGEGSDSMNDEQCITCGRLSKGARACLDCVRDAWEKILQFRPRVYRYIYRKLHGDEPNSQDITQEVFLHVYRHLQSGQLVPNSNGDGDLYWLLKLASWKCKDYFASSNRQHKNILNNQLDAIECLAKSPSETLEESERAEFVSCCVTQLRSNLKPSDLEIFDLRMEGLTHVQISDFVGMSSSGARLRWYKITNQLKELLKTHAPDFFEELEGVNR